MRVAFFGVGLLLLALAAPAGAQSSSSGKTNEPPKEIAGKSLARFIEEIGHRDPSIRENAIRTVPYFGKPARDAVPALTKSLGDFDSSCRVHSCLSLIALVDVVRGEDLGQTIDALCKTATKDAQAIVRFHAVIALGMFKKDAYPAAMPALIWATKDRSSWEIRRAAVVSLSNVAEDHKNGPGPDAVGALAALLTGPTYEESCLVRLEAVIGLGAMGKPALPADRTRAVQALQRSLKDPDKGVSIWAVVSLMALEGVTDEGLDIIAKHLQSKSDLTSKAHAARALAAMGRDAKPKVKDLAAMLNDRDPYAQAVAVNSLAELGPYAAEATPALDAVAKDKNRSEGLREMAKAAIKQIEGGPRKDK
jgi:HEAT repeat protein